MGILEWMGGKKTTSSPFFFSRSRTRNLAMVYKHVSSPSFVVTCRISDQRQPRIDYGGLWRLSWKKQEGRLESYSMEDFRSLGLITEQKKREKKIQGPCQEDGERKTRR